MIKNFKKQLLSLTLATALAFGSAQYVDLRVNAGEEVEVQASVSYAFNNTKAGYAAGKITISNCDAEKVELYWGDSAGNKLKRDGVYYSSIAEVKLAEGNGSYTVANQYTAIPNGAKTLLVYDGTQLECKYTIPSNKLFNLGTKKYSFGVFSDIHYNRYVIDGKDYAVDAFNKCLDFMQNKAKVSFVTGTGDLSKNSEKDAFEKFSAALKKHSLTVYTCMGNHDVYGRTYWKQLINTDINKSTAKSKGILNVADNEIDFVYQNPNYKDEVYIFLSQQYWRGPGVVDKLLNPEQLDWLEEMLATYSNKTVFLYLHTYLSDNNGDVTKGVGNLLAPNNYTYDLTYPVGTADEKKVKALLKKYANVTMFSGHSHWSYATQQYNSNLNVGNLGSGATLVHVSSVGDPRDVLGGETVLPTLFPQDSTNRVERAGLSSESMIVDVYNGTTVYNGIETDKGEYLAYASYIVPTGAKTTPVKMNIPKKGKIKTAVKASKTVTKATVTWTSLKYAKGYEIQYSTSKKFKVASTLTIRKKGTKVTLKKLNKKKTYYVRYRGYTKAYYGKERYGAYSKPFKMTVKKAKKKK